jgi:PTH1 family peptidyl-tRNA hydrolase
VKVIVGLGNPGVRYQWTRHNIGFKVVDRLAHRFEILISAKRFHTLHGTGRINFQEVVLAKPMTFMNRSGEAIRKTLDYFQIGMEDLIVIHDDLDLSFGRLRFKRRGGDGGHQGVRSIIESTEKNAFVRLKVGIGRPPRGTDPAEYVLNPFNGVERSHLDEIVSQAAESVVVMLSEGIETAMSRFQGSSGRGEV